jgi:hypothetical protein
MSAIRSKYKGKSQKEPDLFDKKWEMQFYELQKFKKKFGHCDVPDSIKHRRYHSLAVWCNTQRKVKKFSPLRYHADRQDKLNELGFCWDVNDTKFERRFQLLKKYHKKHGHCDVPDSDKNKKTQLLAKWCNNQRTLRKVSPLYPLNRVRRLDELGFSWSILDKKFEHNLGLLIQYHSTHGHCNVSTTENRSLSQWCSSLREEGRKKMSSVLTKERRARLNELDFQWHNLKKEKNDLIWEQQFALLKEYKEKHGHCNVKESSDNKLLISLAHWCVKLRKERRKKVKWLTRERISRLNTLGFPWHYVRKEENDLRWEEQFTRLKEYKKKHGNCDVSASRLESKYKPLFRWILRQRQYYHCKSNVLTPERKAKLDSIGFSWKNPIKLGDAIRISDNDLLEELRRLNTKRGILPSATYINKYGKYTSQTYCVHFGNLAKARKAAGLTSGSQYPKKHSDGELLDDLKRLTVLLGRTPTQGDVRKHGKYSETTYRTRFGSFKAAIGKAGIEVR